MTHSSTSKLHYPAIRYPHSKLQWVQQPCTHDTDVPCLYLSVSPIIIVTDVLQSAGNKSAAIAMLHNLLEICFAAHVYGLNITQLHHNEG